ncbi:MAG: ThiF family adenylyltransferase [Phycisphaerae bacterium]
MLYDRIGVAGQKRLAESRVVLVGCGALGTVLANLLVRAGVGYLRICDRDFIERDNLQRQVLFDEDDIAANLPKAEAAAAKLARINSAVTVEAVVTDVNPENIERLVRGTDLILDGTDNFETRYLINDLAVKIRRPWIYGAVIGAEGLSMTIIPYDTPCLRCVFESPPPSESNPTCDTAGVIGPAVNMVASLQAVETIKLLTGRTHELSRQLTSVDAWTGRIAKLAVQNAYKPGFCPCCGLGDFSYLAGTRWSASATLCGRNAVQVHPGDTGGTDLPTIARKLAAVANGPVEHNQFLLKVHLDGLGLTLFADGRAIIHGTDDTVRARTLYAKYFGA